MKSNRRNVIFVFCGLALATSLAIAGAQAQSGASPSAAPPKLAGEQFKNLKVLKNVPADEIIPAMQFITASLGVECDYCHVREGQKLEPEKDDKKTKQTARKMMEMMFAINKDNFEGHRNVTCYSCHRGAADPVGTPIISDEEPKPEVMRASEPAAKPVLPPADQLLDKYLAEVGGSAALEKVSSRVEKGKITANGHDLPIEVYAKAPDKRLSVMHMPNAESITAFDGKQGWLSNGGRIHLMNAAENDAARIDADLYFAAHVKSLYKKFFVAPGEKIDGHDTYLVVGRTEGQPPLRLYLDKDSGLLLRLVRYAETPLGRMPTQIDYADYRNADGVKVPFRWTLARPGGNRFTIQIDDLKQNVPVEDAKFNPPPMSPPQEEKKPAGQ
ncbi:MAG TPA: c-type cytochrome [Candidatus Methylomirabilis sp.]|nr:c-type cytochrome [Candidatus Methylomirabilis sp.]